ncbi:MAG: dual specificity protein phosphatase family protein [Campylobacter sp.]|nr:dual specificity protein phosphatase family protein [Campylobacter sp.]
MQKFQWFFLRAGYLCVIAIFFYASYSLANNLAKARSFVPEIIFEWEFNIPFLSWTILPYWSLNLLYGIGFLLCKSRREVVRYTMQLFLSQIIAIIFFILFPLQISWQKPQTSDFFGFLFDTLASFDEPFNQAPSLHIILCVVVGSLYIQKVGKILLKAAVFIWFVLIGASVLTTFQHHFIDIPTGLAVGFFVLWLVPLNGEIIKFNVKRTKKHFKWAAIYGVLALFCLLLAMRGGAALWVLWFSLSFFILVSGYLFFGVRIFKKSGDKMQIPAKILLLPYLFIAKLNALFWLRNDKFSVQILPDIYLGSVLDAPKFYAVFDLTAEFQPHLKPDTIYENFALMDMVAPSIKELKDASKILNEMIANMANTDGTQKNELNKNKLLVCCALGYTRSAAVLIAWLIYYKNLSYEEALNLIKKARPKIVINKETENKILSIGLKNE